ncbi:hypothetical protein ACTXT7_015184 [Hymenolepis weldensis]
MMDLVLRASEFGFPSYLRRKKTIFDKITFDIPKNKKYEGVEKVEFDVHDYVRKFIVLAKNVTGRGISEENVEESTKNIWLNSFRPRNFQSYIRRNALRVIEYESHSILSKNKPARSKIFTPILNKKYPPSLLPKNLPVFILVMHAWRLFFWTAISENNNFYRTLEDSPYNDHTTVASIPQKTDELTSTFIFHVCSELRSDDSLLPTDLPMGFCPNPCATAPCLTLSHTTGHGCHLIGRGLFMNDFRCECLPGFKWVSSADIGGFENDTWERIPSSDEIGACVAIDICETYCDSFGTRRCDLILGTAIAVCVCKLTHMGPTCSLPRDPCIELSEKEKMPGNMACNIGQGGRCIPTFGSDFYECRCPSTWTKDYSLDFENCLALKDRCMSEVCVRGDCISSADGSETLCICPEEAYGERCENLRGSWGHWSPWSSCSPACGNGKIRHRERTRGCLYGDSCRGGKRRQVEVCPENVPCPDELVTLGLGPEALAPHDVLQGGEAQPNFDLQRAYTLKYRRHSLLIQVLKFIFILLCAFAVVSATIMFLYALKK